MNLKFNSNKKNKLTKVALLFFVSSLSIVSCQKDDWSRFFKNGRGGNGNGNNGRDTTTQTDSTGKDTMNRGDSTGRDIDSSWHNDTCGRKLKADIDYTNIVNGSVFDSSKQVSFRIKASGNNTCAKELFVKETARRRSGSIVDIYLESEIRYSGCLCSDALVPLTADYIVKREPNSGVLTYYIHISDSRTGSESVNYFRY